MNNSHEEIITELEWVLDALKDIIDDIDYEDTKREIQFTIDDLEADLEIEKEKETETSL